MSFNAPLRRPVAAQPDRPRGQSSRANPPDRRRSAAARRRISVAPEIVTRDQAMLRWSDLVRRRCLTREACAVTFAVTFQTACNWWDGWSCPTGDKVMMAISLWPEEFAAGDAGGDHV